MKKRLSEEEITRLRNLLEKVSMENGSPQSLPTANGELRRLFHIGEWAMIVILCCTLFPLVALAFVVSLLLGNINGSCLHQPYGMAARANLLGASYYFILCFSFHSKKDIF